jgi:hypothetical protein
MSDPKQPTPEKLTLATVFDRLLAYASTPWKAAVVIILVIVGGLGYLLYLERASIADAILHNADKTAQLNKRAFINDAPRLLRDTRADYAMLVALALADNVMTEEAGIDTDGNHWIPTTGPQQILTPASSMPVLVRFLSDDVVCMDTAAAVNLDSRMLASKGYSRICFVGVPPILGVSAGGLVLAWRTRLLEEAEYRAGIAMKSAAMKLATW